MAGATPIREITRQVFGAVRGLRPQIREARRAEAKAFALPGEITRQFERRRQAGEFVPEGSGIIGTEFTGIDPITQLGIGIGRVGQQLGVADTFNQALNLQRGRLDQIIRDIFEENRFRQQLAAARAAGRGGGGGGIDLGSLFGTPEQRQAQALQGATIGGGAGIAGLGSAAAERARQALAQRNTFSGQLNNVIGGIGQVGINLGDLFRRNNINLSGPIPFGASIFNRLFNR